MLPALKKVKQRIWGEGPVRHPWKLYVLLLLLLTDRWTYPLLVDWLPEWESWGVSWHFSRQFGSLYSTLFACALIFFLQPRRRRLIPMILAAVLAAGLVTYLLKPAISRVRPEDEGNRYETRFAPPFEKWRRQYVEWRTGEDLDKFSPSMPSGHATQAFANAAVFSALYPAARPLWYVMATLAALSRIEDEDHFPSDLFAGLIIGLFVARRVLRWWRRRYHLDEDFEPLAQAP